MMGLVARRERARVGLVEEVDVLVLVDERIGGVRRQRERSALARRALVEARPLDSSAAVRHVAAAVLVGRHVADDGHGDDMPAPALRAATMPGPTAPFGVLPPPRKSSFWLK